MSRNDRPNQSRYILVIALTIILFISFFIWWNSYRHIANKPSSLASIIQLLSSHELTHQAKGREGLRALGDGKVPVSLFTHEQPLVRLNAFVVSVTSELSPIPDEALALFHDTSSQVRETTVAYYGRLQNRLPPGTLLTYAKDPVASVRFSLAQEIQIGQIRGQEALDALKILINDSDPAVAKTAKTALRKFTM